MRYLVPLPLSPAPLPVAYCELCNASGNDISRQCDLIASPAAAAAASAFALKVSKTPWPSVPENGRVNREGARKVGEREAKKAVQRVGRRRRRAGNVSSCSGTTWKSPDIAHISHIYKKRSVSTWQTVAEIALSRLANTLSPLWQEYRVLKGGTDSGTDLRGTVFLSFLCNCLCRQGIFIW